MAVDPVVAQNMADPEAEPINKSSDYLEMLDFWELIDTLRGGAQVIRAAGEKYLPRFPTEELTETPSGVQYDPYDQRRQHAPFTDIYNDISAALCSKPFSKELELLDGAASVYDDLAENIDGLGNNFHVVGHEIFRRGVDYAITWVLVDFSRPTPRPDGQPLSVADERAQGLRPYWVHIHPTRLYAVYSVILAGEEIIVHARISEPTTKLEGFIERTVERVRVLNREPIAWDVAEVPIAYGPPTWQLYENVVDQQSSEAQSWKIVDQGVFSIGVIPLVPFISGERDDKQSWVVRPALRSLAWMQVEEFQKESNLKTVLEASCYPMLSGDGVNKPEDGDKLYVGPRAVLYAGVNNDGRPGSFKYIEPSGSSITQLREELADFRSEMRDLGFQPLTRQNLTVITTGQVAVKANSALQAWAIKFKDAMEQCWEYTAMWLGRDDAPEVSVHTDFALGMDDGAAWNAVLAMRNAKEVSHEVLIRAAVRFGYLEDGFDDDKNQQQLAEEQANEPAAQMVDPATGLPVAAGAAAQPPGVAPARPASPPALPQPPVAAARRADRQRAALQ